MEFLEVMQKLEKMGSEQSKKVLKRHGAREPFFGVKISEMKKHLVKKLKNNNVLARQLYNTGNSDAMYLAGLICEPEKMTKEQLQQWVENAYWYLLSEYTVAWVAAESNFGRELAMKWIDNSDEMIAAAGWSTLSSLVMIKPDSELDMEELRKLLTRVKHEISDERNRVKYAMNGFVIAVGSSVKPLNSLAKEIAKSIGKIDVFMGETSCKVPLAEAYISKMEEKGKLGFKKKRAVC